VRAAHGEHADGGERAATMPRRRMAGPAEARDGAGGGVRRQGQRTRCLARAPPPPRSTLRHRSSSTVSRVHGGRRARALSLSRRRTRGTAARMRRGSGPRPSLPAGGPPGKVREALLRPPSTSSSSIWGGPARRRPASKEDGRPHGLDGGGVAALLPHARGRAPCRRHRAACSMRRSGQIRQPGLEAASPTRRRLVQSSARRGGPAAAGPHAERGGAGPCALCAGWRRRLERRRRSGSGRLRRARARARRPLRLRLWQAGGCERSWGRGWAEKG